MMKWNPEFLKRIREELMSGADSIAEQWEIRAGKRDRMNQLV